MLRLPAGTGTIDLSLPGERRGPLDELLAAIWDQDPPAVVQVNGHWRWRTDSPPPGRVREVLARHLGPGTVPYDPERTHRVSLPPTGPSSEPLEVAMYPTVVFDTPSGIEAECGEAPALYLCLFYSMQDRGRGLSATDRRRAYFRVVETLDRLHGELADHHPARPVRAIDLPMPGWMGAGVHGTSGNRCALVSA